MDNPLTSIMYKKFENPEQVLRFGVEECILQAAGQLIEDIESLDFVVEVVEEIRQVQENGMNVMLVVLAIEFADYHPDIEQLSKELLMDGFMYRPQTKTFECRLIFDELGS